MDQFPSNRSFTTGYQRIRKSDIYPLPEIPHNGRVGIVSSTVTLVAVKHPGQTQYIDPTQLRSYIRVTYKSIRYSKEQNRAHPISSNISYHFHSATTHSNHCPILKPNLALNKHKKFTELGEILQNEWNFKQLTVHIPLM